MMDSKSEILANLHELNLGKDEANVYLELLAGPNTHLQLSRSTGINRTKVYRVIEALEKRSLVSRRTDDRGTFLVANDPGALEIELIAEEEKVKRQRAVFSRLKAEMTTINVDRRAPFVVRTYEGAEGFKQMQWHELKAKKEVLILGNVTAEQLTGSHAWAERFRALSAVNRCRVREIINVPYGKPRFTKNQDYLDLYEARIISERILPASTPMVIYDDTVAVYQFDHEKRVGAEIVNAAYATTMRQIFEHYWNLAQA